MSLVVAAVSERAAAMAADGLRVDLSSGQAQTGFAKVGSVGDTLFGIAGVSDAGDFDVRDAVRHVLKGRRAFDDLGTELMKQFGSQLVRAFVRWRALVGASEPAENFLSLMCARPGELVELWCSVQEDQFTLVGNVRAVRGHALVVAAGTRDLGVLAHTDEAETFALSISLTGGHAGAPLVPEPRVARSASAAELSELTRRVVDGGISRQRSLPRPPWFPADLPVLAGPTLVVSSGS